ncbi:FHA domain-containing protein [Carex littledalei]|uniref:FHA domain-containing protein n=1 Tax=Carex littledalei TaxID=544730 RepID=A0A833R766_9POAL|nr:FHA domain-containing protein [Carex littledalei]
MEAGILQITVLKGHKNGETLVCKPGSKVRIGRVIKGNDFAMRDPGISENHLCFHFFPESSRWVVSDLGSSNGTILNESKIQAWVPVPISDSDVIKIGEKSALGLKIVLSVLLKENEEENEDVKGRRVTARHCLARGSTKAGSSGGSEDKEVKEDKSSVLVPVRDARKNAQANSARVSNEEGTSDFGSGLLHKTAHKRKVGGQRSNNAKDNTNIDFNEKSEGNRNSVLFSSVQIEEPDQSRGMKLRRNPRRGCSSSALKEVDMNRDVGVGIEEKGVCVKRKERKGKEIGVLDDEMCNRIDKLLLKIGNDNDDSDNVIISDEGKGFKAKTTVNSSKVTEEEKGGGNIGLKKGLEVNSEVGNHFEKLTLEQWFDSMELFLPKVIHDESEKIINILKEKARKIEEFIEAGGDV